MGYLGESVIDGRNHVLKMKMTFLNIPSIPPPFVSVNSLTNQIYQNS